MAKRTIRNDRRRRRARADNKSRRGRGNDPVPAINEGMALAGQGRLDDAVACFERALAADPGSVLAYYNIGVLRQRQGRLDDAARAYADALAIKPDYLEPLVNLGIVRQAQGRLDDAEAAYRRAIAVNPNFAELHHNLGGVLERRGDPVGAVACYRRALTVKPDYALALNGLGVALHKQGDDAVARAAFERALTLEPRFVEALSNLGHLHHRQGRLQAAAECFRRAIAMKPDYAEAHRNLSHVLLLEGNFRDGWPEFTWRWRCRDIPSERRDFRAPKWSGEPVSGKTVLVWGEQGVGDEVHFAEMVPDLVEAGARVVLECERRLVPLFARSFPAATCVARATPPAPETTAGIDYQTPIGDLGRWLRPDAARFPKRPSYLKADPAKRSGFRDKYRAGGSDLLVGIAWISRNPEVGADKSMALTDWRPLAEVPGVRFVDLQYGDTLAERRAFERDTGTAIVHDDGVDQLADMDAFAAQVAAMDLVVSVSNTTVHVAGALGVPTWVMLNTVPLAVWMRDGEDSPWYPSVRLYRQKTVGAWADVIKRVERDLRKFARR
ncbi:MAG TPA: tetratricopeptide repeat protein [Rhodospirillales bacterium]